MKLTKKYNNNSSFNFLMSLSKSEALKLGWIDEKGNQKINLRKKIQGNKLIIEEEK